ncbi:hypothetical protein [Streptomyces syringium]|uniref:Lipoprotein n=1 Tax=Streptomyces syringium TaxID=76729 RepID=A0ABS4XXJ3_9ACTN|nr:hypothetical protein [Streptomyces syringium]MBP2401246.1 hypothetical protein [Streptomyces syringium]
MANVVTAALACLVVGATVAGCTDGATTTKEPSAERMLDDANDTMNALTSVTIDGNTTKAAGGGYSNHLTTDLKDRCASRTTWATTGAALEQVRIGATDYVRPNRTYLKQWSGRSMTGSKDQSRWAKVPAGEAKAGDGLAECTWEFVSFGVATKGERTVVDGTPAVPLTVTDEADKGGSYTFYVATEGKPYILKVVYKGTEFHSTTSFSAFDKPLDVRPPAKADVFP